MSSSNFLPKRAEFFAFLAAHTDRVVAGANATSRLVNGLGNPAGAAETATRFAATRARNFRRAIQCRFQGVEENHLLPEVVEVHGLVVKTVGLVEPLRAAR